MKILMLCPLISSSSFITTYPYAKILSKNHDVKIVGPLLGGEPYIKDNKLDFEFIEPKIKKPIQFAFLQLVKKNYNELKQKEFDVIHAFKLLPHTAPVAAKLKRSREIKFILSIDDYDPSSPKNPLKRHVLKKSEEAYRSADAITVSSTGLQKLYGGEIIYQVANEYAFTKRKVDPKLFIRKHNLQGVKLVAHAGTLFDFKGIDILIRAIQDINRDDVKLVIAGNTNMEKYKNMAGSKTLFTGSIPIEEVVNLTAACKVYAIPTKDTPYSRVEIPAKVFEPMMLAKAIVASKLSDIPFILDNGKCGLLSKPNNVKDLAGKIEYLLDNPKEANRLGSMAKKRYKKNFSYAQIENKINKIYSSLKWK